jgi:hypothetical protein
MEVDITEFRRNLSKYLNMVVHGNVVKVYKKGKYVAEFCKPYTFKKDNVLMYVKGKPIIIRE